MLVQELTVRWRQTLSFSTAVKHHQSGSIGAFSRTFLATCKKQFATCMPVNSAPSLFWKVCA